MLRISRVRDRRHDGDLAGGEHLVDQQPAKLGHGRLVACIRLRDVIDGAQFQALHPLIHVGNSADEHQWRFARRFGLLQPPADLQPVDPGEHEVQKNQVGLLPSGQLQGVLACLGTEDLISLAPEDKRQAFEQVDIVLDA